MSERKIYYKAFNRDMTCRDQQYEEGGVYELPDGEKPQLCRRGFHFMTDLVLTLDYYPVNNDITENMYAEVEPLGDVVWDEPTKHKGCTNKLRIVRVIPDDEVKEMVDAKNNSGDRNSGDGNSGDGNSGDGNSGHGNSGDRNSGDRNSGDGNSGDWNSGDWNSGHWNSGHRNSGHWNACDRETGAFNTEQPSTVRVFNKPCDWEVWVAAYKPDFLYFTVDEELGYKGSFQRAWNDADPADRILVKDLPNFDADVFFELSGIRVGCMSEAKHTELQAGEYLTQQEAWGRISELESRNTALVEALEAALEWIDSVPDDVQLPAMPGFDRDHVDNVLKQAKGES